jgi:two-component system response regulator ResD
MSVGSTAKAEPLVLAVDTDESVLRLLRVKLTRAGFRVMTAMDGQQALTEALAGEPDLVLLEGMLPGLDGYRVTGELARAMGAKRPAIVFLSSVDSQAGVERALRSGCDDYVVKPFSPEELIHRLRLTLLRRQLAAESHGAPLTPCPLS